MKTPSKLLRSTQAAGLCLSDEAFFNILPICNYAKSAFTTVRSSTPVSRTSRPWNFTESWR